MFSLASLEVTCFYFPCIIADDLLRVLKDVINLFISGRMKVEKLLSNFLIDVFNYTERFSDLGKLNLYVVVQF